MASLDEIEGLDAFIGIPPAQELAEFDRQNSDAGRLGRYLKGRAHDIKLRILMNFLAALGLVWLLGFSFGLTIFGLLLAADVFESLIFYRFFKRGYDFWQSRRGKLMVMAISALVASAYGLSVVLVWNANSPPNPFLAVTLLTGFSMNSGFFAYLYKPANMIKQGTYALAGLGLFLFEFNRADSPFSGNLAQDLIAGIGLAICLMACYSRLARFAETRYQSERTLMVAKLEAEKAHETMSHQALHDPLTGLPNRAYLAQVMARQIETARNSERQLAIFHIDLDKFKEVNDTAGHAAGDFILRNSAEALRRSVRGQDFVARIGGDEFVVLTTNDVKSEELFKIADRIIGEISRPITFMDQELRVGASVGFALSEPYHLSGEAVLLDADLALYEAKNQGRGIACMFSPNMRSEFEDRTQLLKDLTIGVERGEIETVFQPQVDLHLHLVTGFEALVRWRHPTLGILTPDRFIKIADEAGLLNTITIAVAGQAFEALTLWRNAGYQVPCVGINFASRQLENTDMISQVKWMVELAGLEPEDVAIEVLESVLGSSESDQLIQNIKALSSAGFSIDLDDFGTEHASIANMRSFEVSRIKIDKSFVSDIEHRPDQRRLVSAMVQLARSLDVSVLAEGVETGAEIEILAELGCDQVQGFFFARPMHVADTLSWLSECGLIERAHVEQDYRAALF